MCWGVCGEMLACGVNSILLVCDYLNAIALSIYSSGFIARYKNL